MLTPKKSRPRPETPPMPLHSCLAKTRWTPNGVAPGRSVEEHCRIAGAVADNLLARLFSVWPAGSAVFPENSTLAPLLHDIGKVSPKFQKMLYGNAGMLEAWPQLKDVQDRHNEEERHEAISQATILANGASENLAICAGLHHGRRIINPKPDKSELYGGASWASRRAELLAALKGGKAYPVADTVTRQLLLTGLTVVSDWIASGDIFSDPGQEWNGLVNAALDDAGFFTRSQFRG